MMLHPRTSNLTVNGRGPSRRPVATLAIAALAALGAIAAQPSPTTSATYECTVTVGSPTVLNTYPYYDASSSPAPHTFGACHLAPPLEAPATVAATQAPDGCRVVAKRPGAGDVEVQPGDTLLVGDDLWGRCEVGPVDRQVSVTLLHEDEAPAPSHALAEIVPFEVGSSHDGTALRGHVYLPEGDGPFATVLEFSPYWNTAYGPSEGQEEIADGRRTMAGWHRPFMDAGFAVALVNIRGTGESDGCMAWASDAERADAATVVEALAGQPWSNGNVGMFGLSYPGWTQWMAVAERAPSLKAIIPASAVIDYHSLIARNGARLTIGPITPLEWQAGVAAGGFAAGSALTDDRFVPDTGPDHLACPEYAEVNAVHAQFALDGEKTPFFEERDLRPLVAGTEVAALVTSGLTFNDGSITQFEGVWDLLAGPKRLLIGQWGHDLPPRSDFGELAVRWFDRYLRHGREREHHPAVKQGVVEYQDSSGGWHVTDQWPPVATVTDLHLSQSSLVTDPAAATPSDRSFQSSGVGWGRFCNAPDHVRYVSEPLSEDVRLAGNFTVDMTLTSNLPEGNLAAHVWAADGAGCGDPHTQITRAMTTLRHADTPGYGQDFPVGEARSVTVRSLPFASVVRAGQRIVLTVSADATEIMPDPRRARITVSGGTLHLPVVEGTLAVAP